MDITIQNDNAKSGRGTRYVTHTFDVGLDTMLDIMIISYSLKKAGKMNTTYKKILGKAITSFKLVLEEGGLQMEKLPQEIIDRTLEKAKNIQEGMKKTPAPKNKPTIDLSWAD